MFVQVTGGLIETANRMLHLSRAYRCGSHNEGAIFDGLGNGLEFRGLREQRLSANGGTRLAKSQFVGIHHTKMEKAEVAHRTSGGANVERIARGDKNDSQAIGFGVG